MPADEAPDAPGVAVLSHRFYEELGGSPAVLGEALRVDGTPVMVVGVLPAGVRIEGRDDAIIVAAGASGTRRDNHLYMGVGRLREGHTAAQAQAELKALAAGLAGEYPATNRNAGARVLSLREAMSDGESLLAAAIVGVAVAFVLLIACLNIANLMLVRATSRRQELAVRAAMGASAWRIARHLLAESLVLALAGAVAGVAVAAAGLHILIPMLPDAMPSAHDVGLDHRVLVIALGAALASGLLFGSVPAWRAAREDVGGGLSGSGRGSTGPRAHARLRAGLVVAQVALALVLLLSAALMIRGIASVRHVDLGYARGGALTVRTSLTRTDYPDDDAVARYFEAASERISGLAGVTAVGAMQTLPFEWNWEGIYAVPGREAAEAGRLPNARYVIATPGLLGALGLRLRRGRIEAGDRAGAPPVVVVSRELVKRAWQEDEDPIGRVLLVGKVECRVVGVVDDVRMRDPAESLLPTLFIPAAQDPQLSMAFIVRSPGDPDRLVTPVLEALRRVDPRQPVYDFRTLSDVVAGGAADERVMTRLLALFAAIAFLLAVVGVYGVIAYSVSRRRRELGIRSALGAARGDLVRLVIAQGARLAGTGLAIGLALGAAVASALASFLFGVSPFDPLVYTAVTAALLGAALLAS